MIQKVVRKGSLQDTSSAQEDLAYWLSRTPAERVAAVDYLRRQYYGDTGRLRRVAQIIQRPKR